MKTPADARVASPFGHFCAALCVTLLLAAGCGSEPESSGTATRLEVSIEDDLTNPATGIEVTDVEHTPVQPRTAQPVIVTARVTSSNGVRQVRLQTQVVEPGRYIPGNHPDFRRNWRDHPMLDDGTGPDRTADDGIYTGEVPADFQAHRRLVRYRIEVSDLEDRSSRWPAVPHGRPNAAWFVHDGIPPWTGASRPGETEPWTFSSEFLSTLPTYHLIARSEDVENSQWNPSHNRERFLGTLVYEGRVYDHIRFHNRGQASTYVSGKNKWGFRFQEDDLFEARDQRGRPLPHGWDSFNLNACASPWAQVNRGMAGIDEALSYRAYELAGVPTPEVIWIHFRVIDDAEESPRNQYAGDLWGLYLVIQEKDGAWLRQRGLPDGNIFSAESGLKHAADQMPHDGSDLREFERAMRRQSEEWWRTHFDVPVYCSFHAMNRVLGNIDLRPEGNHYLYHPPGGRWMVLPHDLDMMFIPKTHWPGIVNAHRCLHVPGLRLEFQNRAREILDLFCSDPAPNGGQVGQLIAEMAGFIAPPGHTRTWAELDEALWNWHPRNRFRGQFYRTPFHDQRMGGPWVRTLATPDFAGFCRYILEFCTDSRPTKDFQPNDGEPRGYGFGFLREESLDPTIPERPVVQYTGPSDHPPDQLSFSVNPFTSPAERACASLEWRVARISSPGVPGFEPAAPWSYELVPVRTGERASVGSTEFHVDPDACREGHTYRVRARYRDDSGRASHWSEPIQFTAGKRTQ